VTVPVRDRSLSNPGNDGLRQGRPDERQHATFLGIADAGAVEVHIGGDHIALHAPEVRPHDRRGGRGAPNRLRAGATIGTSVATVIGGVVGGFGRGGRFDGALEGRRDGHRLAELVASAEAVSTPGRAADGSGHSRERR
jgi:hypothetical protein